MFLTLAGVALSGVGVSAAANWFLGRSDRKQFAQFLQEHPEITFVVSRGHRLAVRTVRPRAGVPVKPHTVFVPNGMATTMLMLGQLQDQLAEAGFVSIVYDRYGCGLSDDNAEGVSPTVEETLQDMLAVYRACFPAPESQGAAPAGSRRQVILFGPSMGSIVGQCFVAAHPGLVAGFMNIDGVAHPFFKRRFTFQKVFGSVYVMEAMMARLGAFRPMLKLAKNKLSFIASPSVPVEIIVAQMHQAKFWSNVGYEMKLMMDLCAYASDAWGPGLSMVEVSDLEVKAALLNATPARSGSESKETGEWVAQEATGSTKPVPAAVVEKLRGACADSVLGKEWAQLAVYVLSARDYKAFGCMYPQDMRDWAQLEHAVQPLLGREDSLGRDVCPNENHGGLFFNTLKTQVRAVERMDAALTTAQLRE